MSAENDVHEIKLGETFRPYRYHRRLCAQGEGDKPLHIPENYAHGIALRKPVQIFGILGSIDMITDDPNGWIESFIKGPPVEKPLGETCFQSIYRGPGNQEFTEEPCILRLSFQPQTPIEYFKLLGTYAHVDLGKERYVAVLNSRLSTIRRDLRLLEQGEQVLVVTKNLINVKLAVQTVIEEDTDDKDEIDRSFVWIPPIFRKLRTPKFTFKRYDDGDGEEAPETPPEPEKRTFVLV